MGRYELRGSRTVLREAAGRFPWSTHHLLHWTLDIAFGRINFRPERASLGKLSGHQAVDTEHTEAKQIT